VIDRLDDAIDAALVLEARIDGCQLSPLSRRVAAGHRRPASRDVAALPRSGAVA